MRRLTITLDEADEANLRLIRERFGQRSDAAALRLALRLAAAARTIELPPAPGVPTPPAAPGAHDA